MIQRLDTPMVFIEAIDYLADVEAIEEVFNTHDEPLEAVIITKAGSVVTMTDTGLGFTDIAKDFNIGLERATVVTPVNHLAELKFTLDCLIEMEKRNED